MPARPPCNGTTTPSLRVTKPTPDSTRRRDALRISRTRAASLCSILRPVLSLGRDLILAMTIPLRSETQGQIATRPPKRRRSVRAISIMPTCSGIRTGRSTTRMSSPAKRKWRSRTPQTRRSARWDAASTIPITRRPPAISHTQSLLPTSTKETGAISSPRTSGNRRTSTSTIACLIQILRSRMSMRSRSTIRSTPRPTPRR